jgi:energy-coupling factor transporter ATP-binding protein EcfA2
MNPEPSTQSYYSKLLHLLQQEGKQKFGHQFFFRKTDFPLILQLMYYFLNDEEKAKEHKIDLHKGLMISGPIGCGKTTLLELMKLIAVPEKKYLLTTSREISFEFIQDGYEVIQRYSKGIPGQHTRRNIAFDDIGTERNLKHYGNECNIMAEILLSRYDLFIQNGFVTHITTNLSATELEEFYGNRVRSRLRNMCNLIFFDKEAVDKR